MASTGVYIAKRNGTCQHCGHHFFSSNPTPGPLCFHCKTSRVVHAKMLERASNQTDPEPVASGSITWGGQTVNAPGFTQDQFDRAMGRAFVDELDVKPERQLDRYLVGHPNTYAYAVTRERCTCKAGEASMPCKHRAVLIAHLDIRQPAITKQWARLNASRPAQEVHA